MSQKGIIIGLIVVVLCLCSLSSSIIGGSFYGYNKSNQESTAEPDTVNPSTVVRPPATAPAPSNSNLAPSNLNLAAPANSTLAPAPAPANGTNSTLAPVTAPVAPAVAPAPAPVTAPAVDVVPSNLVSFVNKYSPTMGDSCSGTASVACHGVTASTKLGCMSPTAVTNTEPLYNSYAPEMGDSCAGFETTPCHGVAKGGIQGYVWNKEVAPGKMNQLYYGYSPTMTDSCLGIQGTPCHGATMTPTGKWVYKPEHCT